MKSYELLIISSDPLAEKERLRVALESAKNDFRTPQNLRPSGGGGIHPALYTRTRGKTQNNYRNLYGINSINAKIGEERGCFSSLALVTRTTTICF